MTFAKRQTKYLLIIIILLLGGLIMIFKGSTPVIAIGTSVVASGIVGALELVYRYLINTDNTPIKAASGAGLYSVHDRRDLDRYHELMPNASESIDIIGYSLRNFFDSFGDLISEKATKSKKFSVRILLADPQSEFSKSRESLEGLAGGTFSTSAAKIVTTYADHENVSVRFFSDHLSTMVFRIDKTMFVGPQFISTASKSAPTFELTSSRDAWLFDAYQQEFEKFWETARNPHDETN